MIIQFPFLAEISDKMMSWPTLIAWVLGLVIFSWVLVRKKKWYAMITTPFAVFFAWASYDDLRDPFIRPAVVTEFGYSYFFVGFIPIVAIVLLLILGRSSDNRI